MKLSALMLAATLVASAAFAPFTTAEARPASFIQVQERLTTTPNDAVMYTLGVYDGGSVFLHDVFNASFYCADGGGPCFPTW